MGCFGLFKGMLFAFNGIIFLAGAAILGVGIWVKVNSGSIFGLIQKIPDAPSELSQVLNVGYLLIAVGAVLLIIGFLGCCGAAKESKCLLLLFFIIILVVFIAEVAGAIVLLVFKPLANDLLLRLGQDAVASIKKDFGTNPDITGLWNTTMATLQCCGFNNYTDFDNSPYYNLNSQKYPPLCCTNQIPCRSQSLDANSTGCFPKLLQLINDNLVIIVGVALGIAALEIFAMIASMTMYCKIGKRDG